VPNPISANHDREADTPVGLAREHIRRLKKLRDYKLDLAYERRRSALRGDIEFAESAALTWALGIVEKFLDGVGNR
jgi:hypothetical protein